LQFVKKGLRFNQLLRKHLRSLTISLITIGIQS
jgi:hypothetical protein